jgi:hypothetical protein
LRRTRNPETVSELHLDSGFARHSASKTRV